MTTLPDVLRLVSIPVFAWLALRDYRSRRVPERAWYPLAALGIVLLVWDAALVWHDPFELRRFLVRVVVSLGLLVPMSYGFYRVGAFGGADAKAFGVIAVLFPTYPTYVIAGTEFPLVEPTLGVFSLSILIDGLLLGTTYPLAIAARNLLAGRTSGAMFVGLPVDVDDLLGAHGKLLETPEGFTLSGLDLDALRMYLRWRGLALADLREHPDVYRRPATLPEDPNDPTGGAVDPETDPDPGGAPAAGFGDDRTDDPWGAAAFLESIDGSAYGTTPADLRAGLDLVAERETVWISPGIPMLVPLALGLVVAFVAGDLLYPVLGVLGIA